MKLIRYLSQYDTFFRAGCVMTIGNFDGLHKGHQAIFVQLKRVAEQRQLPSVVMSFEPLPREYFEQKNNATSLYPVRLTRFKEKWHYLEQWGIDAFVCLPFNEMLAKKTASQFLEELLLKKMQVKHLIVGEDFCFGCQRGGDLAFLKAYQARQAFTLDIAPVCYFEERRISSTWIREAFQANNLVLVEQLLGRQYCLIGRVIHGDKRARQWGIPTANLNIHRSVTRMSLPVNGVYAVLVHAINMPNVSWRGVANIGRRPTVDGVRHLLEVHLLDFEGDLYDSTLVVSFLHKLRDEKRFDSLELLKQQIYADVVTAKEYHGT